MSKPWYERVRRFGQTNLTEIDPVKIDLEFWKQYWKETRIQGVIINAGGIVAYYPSKFPLQYRAKYLADGDLYGKVNRAAREAGLAVLARMDANRATKDFFDARPDWFCMDAAGNPIMAGDRYVSCVNGPYYKEYIPDALREIIERYQPDGFTDNSWAGLRGGAICYCGNCKKLFKDASGFQLPEKADRNDHIYRVWLKWSYRNRLDNWRLFNAVTAKHGGKDCLWLGMVSANPVSTHSMMYDLSQVCAEAKVVMIDQQGRDAAGGFEENGVNGLLLHDICGWDTLLPESIANYTRGVRTFRKAANPPVESRMWLAEGISAGISPWYHHIGAAHEDMRQFENLPQLMRWHEKNEKYLYNRRLIANAAVLWSQENIEYYGCDEPGELCGMPFRGITKAMTRARIPFRVMHADNIPKTCDEVKLLILPDLAVMSDRQIETAAAFARAGGSLMLTGRPGMLDPDGNKRAVWPFEAITGVSPTGETAGAVGTQPSGWDNARAHTYMRFPPLNRHAVLEPFANTNIIGFGGRYEVVASNGKLESIATFIPPFPIFPPEFSWMNPESTGIPLVFAGESGSGGRIVYFAADIDRCYGRALLPDHGELLASAARWTLRGETPVCVEGPGYLDCKVYEQDDAWMLHIMNLSGLNIYPGYAEQYNPTRGITVTVPQTKKDYTKARLLVADKEIPIVDGRDGIKIIIDEITDHELLLLT